MEPIIPHDERDLIKLDTEAERWLDRIPGLDSYATVVSLIVLDLLAYGFIAEIPWLRFPLLLLHASVLLLALHVSRVRPRTFLIAIGGVIILIVGGAVGFTVGNALVHALVAVAGGLVLAIPPVAILRRMRVLISARGVTLEAVWAAVSVYLLIGSVYAYLFGVVGWANGGPFFAEIQHAVPVDYLYFSFVTQTTVGYGDLTAAASLGRMLAVSEALIGQLYLVTVVALLVSNLGSTKGNGHKKEASGVVAEAAGAADPEE